MSWTSESMTATATVVIAIFTIVLAISGGIQAWFTRRAINLARDEFIANQRPKLRIRNIVVHPIVGLGQPCPSIFEPNELVVGSLYVSNIGGTPALIIEHFVMVYWSQAELPMESPCEAFDGIPSSFELEVGRSCGLSFESKTPIEAGTGVFIRNGQNGWKLWILGWVDYTDNSNIRRRTTFCRRYDPGSGRIIRSEDYDYDNEE